MGSAEGAFLEVQRVRRHLRRAERAASAASVAHLSGAQRRVRTWLLDELAAYRRRGRFPKNHDFRGKQAPVFVDPEGARCAVGHLLELSGQAELVRRIHERVNHVRVRELSNDRSLRAWLVWAGLTLEEAALIQPTYCFEKRTDCWCGGVRADQSTAAPELLEVTIVSATATDGTARARVDAVHASAAAVVVSDELDVRVLAEPGAMYWVSASPRTLGDAGAAHQPFYFAITAETATCRGGDDFALSHPVPRDVALRAVLADDSAACRSVLAEHDPAWLDDETCSGCGPCSSRVTPDGASLAPALAAAVLASIWRFRRARRLRLARHEP